MFRLEDGKDISDEEYESIALPHLKIVNAFIEEFIAPELAAFYIATGYYKNAIWEGSLFVQIRSTLDLLNYDFGDYKKITSETKRILNYKYLLNVTQESPILKVKEI